MCYEYYEKKGGATKVRDIEASQFQYACIFYYIKVLALDWRISFGVLYVLQKAKIPKRFIIPPSLQSNPNKTFDIYLQSWNTSYTRYFVNRNV